MRRSLAFTAFLLVFACTEESSLVAPEAESVVQVVTVAAVEAEGENEHFSFLPPLVPAPTFDGVFSATRSPAVKICLVDVNGECVPGQPTEDFPLIYTMDHGPGSERVRVDAEDEHYIVNWHTNQFPLEPGDTYRIQVTEFAGALKSVYVVLGANSKTLPIKFWIDEDLPSVVEGSTHPSVT